MGQPKDVQAAKVGTNYNWGNFGSANASGVNLSDTANQNVAMAQSGTQQYLNELLNPSYNSGSFKARQDIIDASNNQYANQMGANAIARGARGSATQNILNSIAANRNNDLRNAMTQEDSRISNILNQTQGVENNYFNQANSMSNNILQRVQANQNAENQARIYNNAQNNKWTQGMWNAGLSLAGVGLGGLLSPSAASSSATGAVIDPDQYASANNLIW